MKGTRHGNRIETSLKEKILGYEPMFKSIPKFEGDLNFWGLNFYLYKHVTASFTLRPVLIAVCSKKKKILGHFG